MSVESAEREQRVAEVLAGYLADVEAGRAVDWRDLARRHPELARDLSEFFGQRAVLGRLLEPSRGLEEANAADPDATQASTGVMAMPDAAVTMDRISSEGDSARGGPEPNDTRVRYFGDYELRRVLGNGGMGIVYEARQISLNRPVALKMIRAGAWADPEEVRRFQNEAQAPGACGGASPKPCKEGWLWRRSSDATAERGQGVGTADDHPGRPRRFGALPAFPGPRSMGLPRHPFIRRSNEP